MRTPLDSERRLRDRGRQYDAAAPFGVAADRGALRGGLDLSVEREDERVGQALRQPLAGALNLADPGEKGEQVAFFLTPRREDSARHRLVGPQFGPAAEAFDAQRMGAALAFDDRRVVQ